jgi:hypothetical protein
LLAYPLTSGTFATLALEFVKKSGITGVIDRIAGQNDYAERMYNMLDQANAGSRGFMGPFVDALSGFVPSYATPWKNALMGHPIEFSSISGICRSLV